MERELKRVLLVDGSTTMLAYHGVLLKRLEYDVLTALNAEEALAVMERQVPSLVLTEISLPMVNGVDFIKKLRAPDRMHAAPVIVLTGEGDPELRDACLGMGCAAYLLKPVEPDLLYRTIQSVSEAAPRENIRLMTCLPVVVGDGTALGGAVRTEYATALSEGGLYVRTLYPQPKNTVTPLRLVIRDREINARAVVLYSYALEGGPFKEPGMGMRFVEISAGDREFVRTFIAEQLTRDIRNGFGTGCG
jgi:DNA-binding response OmpR family regulator